VCAASDGPGFSIAAVDAADTPLEMGSPRGYDGFRKSAMHTATAVEITLV
jgi:hypothetical protein